MASYHPFNAHEPFGYAAQRLAKSCLLLRQGAHPASQGVHLRRQASQGVHLRRQVSQVGQEGPAGEAGGRRQGGQ